MKDFWSLALQKKIAAIFNAAIHADIKEILDTPIENAKDSPLVVAIKAGKIKYEGGMFRGVFNAKIVKELLSYGGKRDIKERGYRLSIAALPPNIVSLIENNERVNRQLILRLREAVAGIPKKLNDIIRGLDFGKEAEDLEGRVSDKFHDSVVEKIGVSPSIDLAEQIKLKIEYNQDITKSIVNFSQSETETLRNIVEKAVVRGDPRQKLKDALVDRFAISQKRAKFIARQETSLFTSKLKEIQYSGAGIKKYRWHAIGDSRTRYEHKKANGKTFFWDHSLNKNPVLQEGTGRPVHAGESWNCRCQAVPIVEVIE